MASSLGQIDKNATYSPRNAVATAPTTAPTIKQFDAFPLVWTKL